MKIAVRMDDISPGMDWDKFNTFYQMLKDKGIYPLLGVVPNNQDVNLNIDECVEDSIFWERIRGFMDEGCAIAMHGYDHIYTTKKGGLFPLNDFSEFAGIDYAEQKKQISLGKKILAENGVETDLFMAPAHSYDINTLKALKECGFNKITDGFGIKPYAYKKLTFYPIAFKQGLSLKRKNGTTTFVVHSNTMSEGEFARWKELLNRTNSVQWIPYNELLAEKSIKHNFVAIIVERLLAVMKHILVSL